eukprot:gnl/TRDRNA2_/TRDRNA2_85876_c0_seq2.p1 gnl/TRDRNA2_/TRDRNA2_85876_c0~~gnl/TRDRNA2_/TRDRNA2_85876_c0_seq2.p1  ORF type:complete len:192 (+),score=31.17 gnl/TRDRNA2_/TRDRNA2_85876_c0_seq2:107-682(+)
MTIGMLLLAVGPMHVAHAASGSLRALHIAPSSNTTADLCVVGFQGVTPDEQCDSLLHFLTMGDFDLPDFDLKWLFSSGDDERERKPEVPEKCKISCDENRGVPEHKAYSTEPVIERDGSYSDVKCCHTVERRLKYYEDTNDRCEYSSTCWPSLRRSLPGLLKHYRELKADCDKTCKNHTSYKKKKYRDVSR